MARTVLLADDSVTAQNMGRRILMDAGYEVVTVNNGSAALKKIHEQRPDLIVLDVYMPGYGGLEVCQRLKESPDTARIPVLLSVGKMEPFKADEAKRVRADGHIVKPFEASELLAALTKLEDRIVPPDSRDGRAGKSEKRGRTWQTEDTVAGADAARTDRVAYLSEAKKRQSSSDASSEASDTDVKPEAAASDQPTAERAAVTPSARAAPVEIAAAGTPASETPAFDAENSRAWVLGKSVFGKPVHGELTLGESIVDKTVIGRSTAGASESEAATSASAFVGAPRWIAESLALTAEEASLDLDELMQRSRAVSVAVAAEGPQVSTSVVVVNEETPEEVAASETVNPAGAAFAAAASAASSAVAVSSQHSTFGAQPATSDSEATAEVTTAAPEVAAPVPSEATAAWENWQQIRDSVMSPKKAEAIAESVAEMATAQAGAQAIASAPGSAAEQNPAPSVIASAAAAEEVNSINDIVDSVLADLKPRLMAEISKKLASKK